MGDKIQEETKDNLNAPNLDEIRKLYEAYENVFVDVNSKIKLLDRAVELYDKMSEVNIKYKQWDESKGKDHEAIYFIADFIMKFLPAGFFEGENGDLSDKLKKEQKAKKKAKKETEKLEKKERQKRQLAQMIYNRIDRRDKINLHIIEPHPDDAIGSASGLCYSDHIISTLHTITRVVDKRDYVNMDSASCTTYQNVKKPFNIQQHKKYELCDLHWDMRMKESAREYKEVALQYGKLYSEFEQLDRLEEVISGIIKQSIKEDAFVAFPLGIEHPMHMLVSFLCMKYMKKLSFPMNRIIVYIDHPYDFQNLSTNRIDLAHSYLESKFDNTLFTRYDDGSINPKLLGSVISEIYGEKHFAEFDGTLEKTMCSYLISDDAFEVCKNFLSLHKNNVLLITAQAKPFLKTGGLGEVVCEYAKAVKHYVNDVRILMPKYKSPVADNTLGTLLEIRKTAYQNPNKEYGDIPCIIEKRIYQGTVYYLLDVDGYFNQENPFSSINLGESFALFCDVVLQKVLNTIDFSPTVLHCNDWQTALIPFLKKTKYSHYRKDLKIMYTIHFFGYQGIFSKEKILKQVGLAKESCKLCISCSKDCVLDKCDLLSDDTRTELHINKSQISFMKAGIEFADIVTTVSKGYAKDMNKSYPDFANVKVKGIRNGVNDRQYPFSSNSGFKRYNQFNYREIKNKNKDKYQHKMGLNPDFKVPILCMVSRLTPIKGLDHIKNIIHEIMALDVQFVIIGDDEDKVIHPYKSFFETIEAQYPGQFAYNTFQEELEYLTYASSDILLMPSTCEACGTTQINAMMYGVIPIVTRLSSFEDSVLDYSLAEERISPDNWDNKDKGIGFYSYNDCWVLLEVIKKAVSLYAESPEEWDSFVKICMETDFGWKNNSLFEYVKTYNEM